MKRSTRAGLRVLSPLLLLAAFSTPLLAADPQAPTPLNVETVGDLAVYEAAILNQLNNSETYAEITPEKRSRALILVSEIATIIDRDGPIDAMSPQLRIGVFNRQEEVNQILAQAADDSRVVCRRERPTGSKLPVNKCLTVAERRKEREGGRQYLRDIIPAEAKADVR